ncbi:MAG: MBL fold metallo-hydrolase [FCB group bacterium]|jgi:metallo-beta-lactamase family protein|nr:MBL fold metallo-hydrolase [FCB group bacterium]
MIRVTSYGAAQEVTGSKHLVEVDGYRVLLDCGMFQGRRMESDVRNRNLRFDASSLHAVVLSHAHIDHSGVLPVLIRQGFQGRIYATPATRDLCAVMLTDSAHIQQKDAEWLSKKNREFVPPLYRQEDVPPTMKRFVAMPYDEPFDPVPGMTVTFHDAGHVLGSAMVDIEYKDGGQDRRFLYTADIGRRNMPILRDPWVPDGADVVMMESTYGDRDHSPIETRDRDLGEVVRETVARGGKIIVPTFALERAQEFVYSLKRLEVAGEIPEIPVYVDSPLTVNITEIFRLHAEVFDTEFRRMIVENGDPFLLKHIKYISRVEESMALNDSHEPMIIISASGMCETGRILHHLRNNIEDPRNTILIIGFQAKNTLGRRLVEREPQVKIFGVKRPVNAQVKVMNSFSAHAGRGDLIEFGKQLKGKVDRILLVHGENGAQLALKTALEAEGLKVEIQKEGVATEV